MKRIILYCVILGAVLAVPVEKLDVGKLEPVQAVWMHRQDDQIVLETDTDDWGFGTTADAALADLEEHCPGIIYLDTAQFLLVSENAANQIPMLRQHLKDSVLLSSWDGQGQLSDAVKYMASHETGIKLKKWKQDVKIPLLRLQKTKIKNVEKN